MRSSLELDMIEWRNRLSRVTKYNNKMMMMMMMMMMMVYLLMRQQERSSKSEDDWVVNLNLNWWSKNRSKIYSSAETQTSDPDATVVIIMSHNLSLPFRLFSILFSWSIYVIIIIIMPLVIGTQQDSVILLFILYTDSLFWKESFILSPPSSPPFHQHSSLTPTQNHNTQNNNTNWLTVVMFSFHL